MARGWFESSGWITDWSDLELSSEEAPLYSPAAENPSRLHHSHHILSYSFTLSTSRSRSNHQHADHHCGAPFSSQNQTHYNCWSNVISIGNIFLPLAFLNICNSSWSILNAPALFTSCCCYDLHYHPCGFINLTGCAAIDPITYFLPCHPRCHRNHCPRHSHDFDYVVSGLLESCFPGTT